MIMKELYENTIGDIKKCMHELMASQSMAQTKMAAKKIQALTAILHEIPAIYKKF